MTAAPQIAPPRMTVAEFLAWPGDGTPARHQLVDGEIRAMDPASVTHGIIQANIGALFHDHLKGTAGKVVAAPGVIPRVRSATNMRVPDIAINCLPDEAGQRALPDPILVIDILSPSNEAETRENVWAYATIPSVREILLVRSTGIAAELLRRQPDGNWPEQPEFFEVGGELWLESIDFRIGLCEFYTDTYLSRPGSP